MRGTLPEFCACVPYYLQRAGLATPNLICPDVITDYLQFSCPWPPPYPDFVELIPLSDMDGRHIHACPADLRLPVRR